MNLLDRQTIVRLWDEHGAALVLYAQQLCNTPEDVVQEAFLLLVRQGLVPGNPVGWLYRVVRNRSFNATRSRGRLARREAVAAARRGPWFESTADDTIDAAEASAVLQALPTDQREIIVARLWGGLAFEEIAQLQETSVSTVYRGYQRGLAALRERLGVPCPKKRTPTKT
jgi:RNA polymerase sigma factor (sigma-70 family)